MKLKRKKKGKIVWKTIAEVEAEKSKSSGN